MSGTDVRTKGKRFRKPQTGNSNLRERWKSLSADIEDVIDGSTPQLKKEKGGRKNRHANKLSTRQSQAYDIDGDGQIDIREMRLAKVLDKLIEKRQRADPHSVDLPETELLQMRQHAGKLLIANEFIERNQGKLWRYGALFSEKTEEQSAAFIAEHKTFPKMMAYLETAERQRSMRSSHHVRSVVNHDPLCEEPRDFLRQTWVESVRKIRTKSTPTLDIDMATNQHGAIGVDRNDMELHLLLKEATLDDPSVSERSAKSSLRKQQQLVERHAMVSDFVARNVDKLWLYNPQFKDRAKSDIIDEIASSNQFAKDFTTLRAKERVLTLKSSMGVAGCIDQAPVAELSNDPQYNTEFRRVRDRTELLMARRELMKPADQRLAALAVTRGVVPGTVPAIPFGTVREARQTSTTTPLNRTRSDSVLTGLPRILEAPRRIEPTGSFSATKWKFGDH